MRKMTEEHKRRIGESRKRGQWFECISCGKKFWRKPYDIKNGNNKFCSRACYGKYQKGKPKDLSNRKKKYGYKNPNWKGGITGKNKLLRNSKEFKKWKKEVLERDNHTCRKCGNTNRSNSYVLIHAHHVKPFATFPELRFEISNGLTLCKKCHDKEPKGKEIYNIH